MPGFRPRFGRRRRFMRKRRKYQTSLAAQSLDKRIKRIEHSIETKWSDNNGILTLGNPTATATTFTSLLQIAQGTGVQGRIGHQIRVTSVQIWYSLRASDPTTESFGSIVRIMLVRNIQNNARNYSGTDPSISIAGILEDATAGPAGAVISPYNTAQTKKYRILYDKIHTISFSGLTTDSGNLIFGANKPQVFRRKIKHKFKVDWVESGGVLNPNTNGLYLIAFKDADSTDNPVAFNYHTKVLYKDA